MFVDAVILRTIVDMSDSRYAEPTQLALPHDKRSSASDQTIKSENLVKYLNDEFSGSGTDDLAVTRLISSAY